MGLIQLKAEDASGQTKTFAVEAADEHESDVADQIDAYAALQAERAVEPVQAKLDAAQKSEAKLREKIAGEILRIKKLTSTEDEFDAEKEREYLLGTEDVEGLSTERLLMEFDRLPKREDLSVEPKTKGGQPDEGAGEVEGVYGEAVE